MNRIKLKDRVLPTYTKGEEIFNMVSHIVGGVAGIVTVFLAGVSALETLLLILVTWSFVKEPTFLMYKPSAIEPLEKSEGIELTIVVVVKFNIIIKI